MSPDLVQEWINESIRIKNDTISVKSLCSKFPINISEAINQFKIFMEDKQDNIKFTTMYYLSGYKDLQTTKVLSISFVKDCDLDAAKSTFEQIVSCYVYSLQRSELKEACDGYLLSNEDESKLEHSSAIYFPSVSRPTVSQKVSHNVTKCVADKSESKSGPSKSQPDQNGSKTVKKTETVKSKKIKLDQPAQKVDIGKMIQNQKPAVLTSPKRQTETKNFEPISLKSFKEKESSQSFLYTNSDLFAAESSPENSPSKIEDAPSPRRSPKPASTSKPGSSNKTNGSVKGSKRKLNSSQQSSKNKHTFDADEKVESDDDDFIPATPNIAILRSTNLDQMKKHKLVNKTYLDDEGYLVTVKESEKVKNEECGEVPKIIKTSKPHVDKVVVEAKKPKRTAKADLSNKKQMSLTSFFKK